MRFLGVFVIPVVGPPVAGSASLAQMAHRIFQPLQGQRKHVLTDQLLDQGNALAVLPDALGFRVDPGKLRKRVGQPLQPLRARLGVVVLHTATGLQDFVGAHGGVADKDQLVVLVVLADDVPGVELLGKAAAVVLPHEVVDAVVEVIELQVLELGLAGAEQLFHPGDVFVHRAPTSISSNTLTWL